jgi:hypothetical protein
MDVLSNNREKHLQHYKQELLEYFQHIYTNYDIV